MIYKPIPNFFIVGAPKCGTTALAYYLGQNPEIFLCFPKEPYYFATDFPDHRHSKTSNDYLRLFSEASESHIAIGEASAGYLYSREALWNIRALYPHAKIIVLLRNPIDLVYSFHSQRAYDLDEDELDFEQAWRLQELRKKGQFIPANCRTPAFLQYREVGKLGKQLQRLLQIFPRAQVQAIVFDDFVRNTAGVYKEALAFLGVPDDGRREFLMINENKYHKNISLGRFLHYPPRILQRAWLTTKGWLGLSFAPGDWLRRVNTRQARRVPLSRGFRSELLNEFDADIRLLEALLSRSLSWE